MTLQLRLPLFLTHSHSRFRWDHLSHNPYPFHREGGSARTGPSVAVAGNDTAHHQ